MPIASSRTSRPRVSRCSNGRYGPYITDRKKNAKTPKDRDPKTLTLEECRTLLASAPERGGRFGRWGRAKRAAAPAVGEGTPQAPGTQAASGAPASAASRKVPRRGRAQPAPAPHAAAAPAAKPKAAAHAARKPRVGAPGARPARPPPAIAAQGTGGTTAARGASSSGGCVTRERQPESARSLRRTRAHRAAAHGPRLPTVSTSRPGFSRCMRASVVTLRMSECAPRMTRIGSRSSEPHNGHRSGVAAELLFKRLADQRVGVRLRHALRVGDGNSGARSRPSAHRSSPARRMRNRRAAARPPRASCPHVAALPA